MRYLPDTDILSALVRSPRGSAAEKVGTVGGAAVYTSIVVAAELRYGVVRRGSERLSQRVDAVPGAIEIEPWRRPCDRIHGELPSGLERTGLSIGANDSLIGGQALADGSVLVTDSTGEFARIPGLTVENWLRP